MKTEGMAEAGRPADALKPLKERIGMDSSNVEIEPRVAVVGVGGAGCNAVSFVYRGFPEADAVAINTDRDALHATQADRKLYICRSVTKGEGTKGDSLLGRRCAQAHLEEIEAVLSGYDAVFIVAGMGGGTGTGAAPIVAEIAQRMGLITLAIPIMPFSFETARSESAASGLARLRSVCNMTLPVSNDAAASSMPDATVPEMFRAVNKSIADYIRRTSAKLSDAFAEELEDVIAQEEERLHPGFGGGSPEMPLDQSADN